MDYIAEFHDTLFHNASYDSLATETRRLARLFLIDSMGITGDTLDMMMESYDFGATGFDSLGTSIRDYVEDNFDECGHSSAEEAMIIDILDAMDDTTNGISTIRNELQNIETNWLNENWGPGEGKVAGMVLYTGLYSLDYAEDVVEGLGKANGTCLPALAAALAKADAAGATAAALKEIIFAYINETEIDWETTGKRMLSSAIAMSGLRYLKLGWAVVSRWWWGPSG